MRPHGRGSHDPEDLKKEEKDALEDARLDQQKRKACSCPGSNRRPFACEANVITTTLQELEDVIRKLLILIVVSAFSNRF